MASLINIGMSGLGAAQSGMYVLGNNIANADVESYSRQQMVQKTKGAQQVGQVFMGTGTTLADVRRVYNAFIENQLRTTTSLSSDANTYLNQIGPLNTALSGADTGITAALKSFFSAMQDASAKPTEDASRQLLLTSAQSLAKRFNTLSAQFTQQNANINGSLGSMAEQVNNITKTIADLNQQIAKLGVVNGQPNDLLDQRDGAVRELNKLVGVDVVEREGSYDIYLKNGQSLVLGNSTQTLGVEPAPTDPTRMNLVLNRGSTKMDITDSTTGGEIGGLLRYRKDTLDPALNELGRVALVVADAINSQLAQGIDKNGQFGATLFGDINSAAAVAGRSIPKLGNSAGSGNLDVHIKDSGKLTTNDYQVVFTSATEYSVRRLPDNSEMGTFDITADPPPVIDGFTLNLNGGTPVAGDSFKITPTRNAAASMETVLTDPSRLAMASPLNATSGSGNKGTGQISQPTLTSKLDIYDAKQRSDMQTGLKYSTPVKLVFGDDSVSPQAYTMYDSKGNPLGSGTVIPGQENKLQLSVPMVDGSGNPINDASGAQMNFSFEMSISGAPKNGDNYTVSLTKAGSADNRNAQSVIDLQTKPTVNTGDGSKGISFTDAYAKLVSNVGGKTNQASMDSDATNALHGSALTSRNSSSGVSVDEEVGNLVKFQQYYTASSQIIKAAQETFATLINSL
ncbi:MULTISPECIES: flagellar hook-associated protein FlgK [unclassified Pseudomonas]|uniref:flagellar hook-associated protein FlgK n=1 Tax=unclassified Pseudomonas TaxID=196821 RepID=UPI000C888094|nr:MULTISPECIES: flagellar hook-associated protein FlgK [unclassified Pseudomonas]PMZ98242.1 flagellar hook-associated protein FlgK [Pseudomonas sp. FW305-42]PNA22714.1 flagellar hook-associated protein FlgK [Pseudomonas sp. MPR-R1B]PNB25603.1 flagellar hook-associated protein FlgK [Pseudomonas sp. DP16D-E2]PNB42757.1 flagellar hook-associated protein FlgK [Pseudomonas sp. FW305-17]PNB59140.1 flagellar hook-associated protein FlgK [Pseudomonas sp. GW531-E2]